MHHLEELKVWKKAMELVESVYAYANILPDSEKFGLISQMKRSSLSVAANIAEGAGRNSPREFKQFLAISQGSAYELQCQLLLSQRLKLTKTTKAGVILNRLSEIQKMNRALQNSLIVSN